MPATLFRWILKKHSAFLQDSFRLRQVEWCAMRIIHLFALGVGLVTLFSGCGRAPEAPASPPETPGAAPATGMIVIPRDSPRLKEIRVEPVRMQEVVRDEVIAPGRVVMNPNRISRVLPPVQGRVVSVMAKLGDFVEEGQPLLTIQSPDADAATAAYLQAEAAERQAKAALAKAEADLKRTTDLYEHRAAAEKDLLSAQNEFAQARAASETAQAARQQTSLKLELLGLKPNDFRKPIVVRAPIRGTVTDIGVAPGEYRAAVSFLTDTTTPLMSIADLSTVWITSDVPEPFVRFIRIGEPVTITLVAYPGEVFTGRVARVASTLDPQTRTLKVHIEVPNPHGRFRPEMFATVRHSGATRQLPVVPLSAVVHEYGRPIVFLERGPGQFERRQITMGSRVGDFVSVVSGLDADSRVVIEGAMLLKGL